MAGRKRVSDLASGATLNRQISSPNGPLHSRRRTALCQVLGSAKALRVKSSGFMQPLLSSSFSTLPTASAKRKVPGHGSFHAQTMDYSTCFP